MRKMFGARLERAGIFAAGAGTSVAEFQARLLASRPPLLPSCATCGAQVGECTDSHWKGGTDAR